MQNTFSVSVRLILSISMLAVLSACGGGGGSSDNDPPPPPPPPTNTPPVLDPIGAQSIGETETLNFTVAATDADSTTPDLTATGLPTGATFDPANGAFNWVPVISDAANSPYSVTFTAADEVDATLTVTETVEITVTAVPVTADCTVGVTSPVEGSLQAAGTPGVQDATATLDVDATLSCTPEIPVGVAIKLAVAGASNGSTGEEIVTSAPFSNTFTGLSKDEYTVTATVVDSAGAAVSGANTAVEVTSVGIGDYYIAIGDSITVGFGDDVDTDDTSLDGRNTGSGEPGTGGGYTPILNNLLTSDLGYPHTVIAIAVQGTTSTEGVNDVPVALVDHPKAQRVLVKYGMNDAGPPFTGPNAIPSGLGIPQGDPAQANTFKGNMQQIINFINNEGKEPVLAKINIALADSADDPISARYPDPDTGARSERIKEFNQVIDELLVENTNITIAAPDFYTFFLNNTPAQYFDNIHPNGVGYQSMAEIWRQVLNP